MIVKNEEKNIRRALSWGKDIMCEQIVVDTGSSDRTVEIAREMGAKIFFFPWINDFAAAKNFAIDQAKGDWIAFLDADESFTPEDTKKIPEGSRVIIYGAGNVGRSFSTFIERTGCYELIAVCDKKAELLRKQGVKVIDKSELPKYEFDYIIVAVLRKNVADSIKEELSFIDSDKILWLKPVLK